MEDTSAVFWQKVKKCRPNKQSLPAMVDDAHNPKSIADMFKANFDELYNCISYREEELTEVTDRINYELINNLN